MSRPALVLFDLDDVLVGYDHAARLAALSLRTGIAPKDAPAADRACRAIRDRPASCRPT